MPGLCDKGRCNALCVTLTIGAILTAGFAIAGLVFGIGVAGAELGDAADGGGHDMLIKDKQTANTLYTVLAGVTGGGFAITGICFWVKNFVFRGNTYTNWVAALAMFFLFLTTLSGVLFAAYSPDIISNGNIVAFVVGFCFLVISTVATIGTSLYILPKTDSNQPGDGNIDANDPEEIQSLTGATDQTLYGSTQAGFREVADIREWKRDSGDREHEHDDEKRSHVSAPIPPPAVRVTVTPPERGQQLLAPVQNTRSNTNPFHVQNTGSNTNPFQQVSAGSNTNPFLRDTTGSTHRRLTSTNPDGHPTMLRLLEDIRQAQAL